MLRVVVLGGNGFLGLALRRSQLTHLCPQCEIICLDKSVIDLSDLSSSILLHDYLKVLKPHVVIQLACIKRQSADSADIFKLNNLISQVSANALSNFDVKLIYLSSCAVFGEKNNQDLYSEGSIINPTSYYGSHKANSERIYQDLIKPSNLVILRPPLIYSMYQASGYHPGQFVSEAVKLNQISLWGDGTEKREFINIYDATSLILRMCDSDYSGIFNLVSGHSYSYIDLANHIGNYKEIDLVFRPRSGPLVNHTYSSTKLKELFPDFEFLTPFTAINLYFQPLIL